MTRNKQFADAVTTIKNHFLGEVILPGDPGYDEARRVHNGLIDKRPAVIARCRGTADIVDAVRFGRELGLNTAIRAGAHNVSGRATVEDGLMIDLSLMRGVHVDVAARTATAQPGALWADFNRETQLHGLATPGGFVSTTGIAGLTLGGGFGWITSKFGLAADNLVAVDIVTADASVLRASEKDEPDLFWAVRGAGANFGIVSSFEFRLHPLGPVVIGGLVAHPIEKAGELLPLLSRSNGDGLRRRNGDRGADACTGRLGNQDSSHRDIKLRFRR